MSHDADLHDDSVRFGTPFWRRLALLALTVAGLLAVVLVLLTVALISAWQQVPAGPPPLLGGPPPFPGDEPDGPPMPAPSVRGAPWVPERAATVPAEDPRSVPYPVRADLARAEESEQPAAPRDTAAQRWLRQSELVVPFRKELTLPHVIVSPDGKHLAAVTGGRLLVGSVQAGFQYEFMGEEIEFPPTLGGTAAGGGSLPDLLGGPSGPGGDDAPSPRAAVRQSVIGQPTWYRGAPVVYYAVAGGQPRRYRIEDRTRDLGTEALAVAADVLAPVPEHPEQLVLVRARPEPKVETMGLRMNRDPSEVAHYDLATRKAHVLIPTSRSAWTQPAVAPDGSRLALVSDRGYEDKYDPYYRLFLVPLSGGEPTPVTAPALELGPVCWTPDSTGLVYARSQRPFPPECWEDEPGKERLGSDLYYLDLASGRETRLSRGGGCFSPSVDSAGNLYYLTAQGKEPGGSLMLRRVPLAAARAFAAKEKEAPVRTAALWQQLAARVLADAGLAADAEGARLTPELLAKTADAYRRAAEEMFGLKPPASLEDVDRLLQEIDHLPFPTAAQPRLRLVLGSVIGEYLRQHAGTPWRLVPGPLLPDLPAPAEPPSANPFVHWYNPFAISFNTFTTLKRAELTVSDAWGFRRQVLSPAEGRKLVLTNAAAPSPELLVDLTDPDLARGEELLRQGKAEEGDRLLRELLQRVAHRENQHLVLHVGSLLYREQRLDALADLMRRQTRKAPFDARKFNLLGLAQLPKQPEEAINSFKSALRCDLHYGPAYLNLAQALQQLKNRTAAAQCLRRYVQLFPDGPNARDAQRRLGELMMPPPKD